MIRARLRRSGGNDEGEKAAEFVEVEPAELTACSRRRTGSATWVIQLLANGLLQQMVQPIAYGAALGIHPLAVLVVTIAGGCLFGAVGLILAAPLTSAVTRITADLAHARSEAAGEESQPPGEEDAPPPEGAGPVPQPAH